MSDESPRLRELRLVQPEHQIPWVVGQIDEVEALMIQRMEHFSQALEANTATVEANTAQQKETARRIGLAVLGALLAAMVTLTTTIIIVNFVDSGG